MEEDTFTIYTDLMDTMGMTQAKPPPAVLTTEADQLTREVLGQVAGRWSIAVLCTLAKSTDPIRFSRVLDGVDGITQKVLTTTLRNLERDGFVSRRIYAQVPPRVDYALTPLGRDLYDRVDPLLEWARTKAADFQAARERFGRRDGVDQGR
jgi:DNA-binding HxlR family transcriptional regulator